jgi:hypothetical protein
MRFAEVALLVSLASLWALPHGICVVEVGASPEPEQCVAIVRAALGESQALWCGACLEWAATGTMPPDTPGAFSNLIAKEYTVSNLFPYF